MYYHYEDGTDCFIAYNMHGDSQKFALPALVKGKLWYRLLSTADEQIGEVVPAKQQKEAVVSGRTIEVYIGKKEK